MGSFGVDMDMDMQMHMQAEDEEMYLQIPLVGSAILQLTLKAVLELGVFEIIAKGCEGAPAQPAMMTAQDIAAQLPTKNPQAAAMVDRMLALLASFKLVTCTTEKKDVLVRRYGPAPMFKWLAKNENGTAAANLVLLSLDPNFISGGLQLKEAVLEGGVAFEKAHGTTAFEYKGTDPKFSRVFNESMEDHSTLTVNKMLEVYKGFNDIEVLVDVGGGVGATLGMIVARYPHIRGINLDLPHAISDALPFPGVEHLGGDMFDCIPHTDGILLKWVLHNWSDEHCVKILKNCYKALSDEGKVIIVDYLLPATPQANVRSQSALVLDVMMLVNFGGKERTKDEFETLAKEAGFAKLEAQYFWGEMWIIELKKQTEIGDGFCT